MLIVLKLVERLWLGLIRRKESAQNPYAHGMNES